MNMKGAFHAKRKPSSRCGLRDYSGVQKSLGRQHVMYYLFTVSHAFMFSSLPSISSLNSIFYHYLHSLTWRSVKNSKDVQPVFINQALQEHSDAHSFKYCLWLLLGLQWQEFSRCERDHIACKTKNIYFMKKSAKSTLVGVCVYTHIYTYLHRYIYTYIHIYIHTYIYVIYV